MAGNERCQCAIPSDPALFLTRCLLGLGLDIRHLLSAPTLTSVTDEESTRPDMLRQSVAIATGGARAAVASVVTITTTYVELTSEMFFDERRQQFELTTSGGR